MLLGFSFYQFSESGIYRMLFIVIAPRSLIAQHSLLFLLAKECNSHAFTYGCILGPHYSNDDDMNKFPKQK